MIEHIKKILPYVLAVMVGTWAGFYIGTQYYPRIETRTERIEIEKPVIVQGAATTVKETEIAYVPKETITVKYIDAATGQKVTGMTKEKTDLDANIGKMEFNVRLNGKEIPFTKADNEEYLFEKNKIALNQSSMITFDAKIEPYIIDRTKRWGIGVGYGKNGIAYKLDFPMGNSNYFGGWAYKDNESKAGGLMFRF